MYRNVNACVHVYTYVNVDPHLKTTQYSELRPVEIIYYVLSKDLTVMVKCKDGRYIHAGDEI